MKFQSFLQTSSINASDLILAPLSPTIILTDGHDGQNDVMIKRIFRMMYDARNGPRPKFVLCILPFNDVAIYNSIKTVANTKAGIYIVYYVASKLMKEQRQD